MQQAVQQVVQQAPGWVQGTLEATGRVEVATGTAEEATGKVGDTNPWVSRQGRQSTQGATGAARWSTRAQTALATPETDRVEGTSRADTSRGSLGRLKGGSARVEEVGSSGSRGIRAGQGLWSGCSSRRRAADSQ